MELQALPVRIVGYRPVRHLYTRAGRDAYLVRGDTTLLAQAASDGDCLATELAVLAEVDHRHLVPVIDLAFDDRLVVIRPFFGVSLAAALEHADTIEQGAVVTALAPVASAVGALHAIGAAGVALSGNDIFLDDDGAPVIYGEGVATRFEPPLPVLRAADPHVQADCAALRTLAHWLFELAGQPVPEAVAASLDDCDATACGAALLALCPALPLHAAEAPTAAVCRVRPNVQRQRVRERTLWKARIDTLVRDATELSSRILPGLRAVRRPVWIAGAAGAVALGAAIALGTLGAPGHADAMADTAPRATASASQSLAVRPVPTGIPAAEAVRTLLEARELCLASDDAECLAMVVLQGGALWSSDDSGAPQWRLPGDASYSLRDDYGDAVVVAVHSETAPASVLAVSTEAGWLLREVWTAL